MIHASEALFPNGPPKLTGTKPRRRRSKITDAIRQWVLDNRHLSSLEMLPIITEIFGITITRGAIYLIFNREMKLCPKLVKLTKACRHLPIQKQEQVATALEEFLRAMVAG